MARAPEATADANVPPVAAPARHDDLSGLPPAWIGIGTNDLFHDEDVTYARRLQQAGVASTLRVVPGAYHNFDSMEPKAAISRSSSRPRSQHWSRLSTVPERTSPITGPHRR